MKLVELKFEDEDDDKHNQQKQSLFNDAQPNIHANAIYGPTTKTKFIKNHLSTRNIRSILSSFLLSSLFSANCYYFFTCFWINLPRTLLILLLLQNIHFVHLDNNKTSDQQLLLLLLENDVPTTTLVSLTNQTVNGTIAQNKHSISATSTLSTIDDGPFQTNPMVGQTDVNSYHQHNHHHHHHTHRSSPQTLQQNHQHKRRETLPLVDRKLANNQSSSSSSNFVSSPSSFVEQMAMITSTMDTKSSSSSLMSSHLGSTLTTAIPETTLTTVFANVSGTTINNNTTNSTGPDEEYIHFRDNTRFWVQRVLVPIIMIIGIIGNSITMIIMTRRRMRSSTNWYLAALAIFDMIYLIFTFILSLKHYPNAHSIDYYYYWYLFPLFTMITDASSNTSVWLTVTFTIERYIAVCHPIKGKVICTESRAKRVIICVFIICLSVTLPTPFEWVVVQKMNNETQQVTMEAEFSELGMNETYKNIYYHLTVFLFVLIPLILLVIFNSFLIRSVHISNKERSRMVMGKDKFNRKTSNVQTTGGLSASSNANANVPSNTSSPMATSSSAQHSSSSRQEIRITIMLIAVVILFIMCQTPTACILVYSAFHQWDGNTNQGCILVGLSNIFNFLMSINSAGNFVLYCLLSQKYRRTFVNMFCPCWKRNKYLHQSNTCGGRSEYSVAATTATTTYGSASGPTPAGSTNNHHHRHHRSNRSNHQTFLPSLDTMKNKNILSNNNTLQPHPPTNLSIGKGNHNSQTDNQLRVHYDLDKDSEAKNNKNGAVTPPSQLESNVETNNSRSPVSFSYKDGSSVYSFED